MRNKKLHKLQSDAEKAFGELSAYLKHLDARETDASYVHARMLFDENWRLKDRGTSDTRVGSRYVLWIYQEDADEQNPLGMTAFDELSDGKVLKVLQLSKVPSTVEVLNFLIEITEEVE